jgi:DNA-binding beta-propeller fold protein YncE
MKTRSSLSGAAILFCAAVLSAPVLAQSVDQAQMTTMRFDLQMSIGTEGDGEGQFKYVEDFAFDAGGRLYATDAAHAWVQVFDKTTGKFITRFGGKGEEDAHLEKPEGIAIAPDGSIFIADYTTGYIKKYDRDHNWLLTFSEYGEGPGQNFKSEFISIYDGKLYLPEVGNHQVDVFDLDGKFLFSFGGMGMQAGQMNNPESAKANSEGKIYVADLKNDRIQVFDKDGKFLFLFGSSGSAPGQLKAPAGIAFDKAGNVYVTEIGNDRVSVFDKNGAFLTSFGSSAEFENLHGIAVDQETGFVYIANSGFNRIDVYKPVAGSS